ncbi:ABC transporter permease subunit [Botrimarina mediterranea]|uniref:ABC transporter permease subunit n=1 Tax=Botrimarina mediterranea TaxID=2528022 RepID=UPI001188924E|nr:ABC-2 family transporter protein [Planctomycetes bacterium K2D]
MPLGPVFRHEMLAAGRKRRYFWVRVLVGVGMLLLLAMGYLSVYEQTRFQQGYNAVDGAGRMSISGAAMLSSTFYVMFAWATMLGVLLITPAIVAGAIATERERRTIEYLFATDLSNAEIVLDKIVARLLVVAKLVLATLPVLAIFRLLGGVPGALLLTHFAMLASTATLTAAIALTVGVWCERARDAVPRAIGAVFAWIVALPMAFFISSLLMFRQTPWADWFNTSVLMPTIQAMAAVHPLMMLFQSSGVLGSVLGIDLDRWAIARMVLLHFVAAAVLLGVCVAMVRRVHLRAAAKPGVRLKATTGSAASRSPYENRPMLWKEMFAASVRKSGTKKWVARLGVAVLLIAAGSPFAVMLYGVITGEWRVDFETYMGVATGIVTTCGSILVLLIGSRAAGLVTYEHERDTLVSLLSTPLDSTAIVSAKTWGNLYAYRWPLIGLALIPLLGAMIETQALLSTLGVITSLALLSWAATAIGLAVSMRMKNSIKAIATTMFVLLAIGVFYSLLGFTFAAVGGWSDNDFAIFVAPPLAPFLIAFPMIVGAESSGPPDEVVASYALGLGFYAVIGFFVTVNNKRQFDRINGRSPEAVPLPVSANHQPLASQANSC